MTSLPIHSVLPTLLNALQVHHEAVLQAPPGAGKTTIVPLALIKEEWLEGKKIILLEPRRLAARGAAWRMADLLGQQAGERVGYRMRGESRVSKTTQIEVVTEGVLTRMLQSDPSLEGVGIIIFDEFHERSLHADLGLSLALQAQELFRNDLRLLVMSATLDGKSISRLLGDAPIINSDGKIFPVETIYTGRDTDVRIEEQTARTVARALREEPTGDVLVFLPGYGEIRRTEERLQGIIGDGAVQVHALHGSLQREEQDRAIQPASNGVRKIVLATSIAETSLTIEGVRIVIDSGLSRVPRYSPRSGMTRLETVRVARASADQRRGRAGRLGPGRCYRLWNQAEDAALLQHISPEILEADLVPLALELARWGAHPDELRWLTSPPSGAYQAACELLRELDALDGEGVLTPHGELMSGLPVHPRLAHLILCAKEKALTELACLLASLLEERDILRGDRARRDPDIALRVEVLRRFKEEGYRSLPNDADRNAVKRVMEGAGRLLRVARGLEQTSSTSLVDDVWSKQSNNNQERDSQKWDDQDIGLLLGLAWPDRIAGCRKGDINHKGEETAYNLSNGRRARLPATGPLSNEDFLVVPSIGGSRSEGVIELAAPISLAMLRAEFSHHIRQTDVVVWHGPERGVTAEREELLGALVIGNAKLHNPDDEAVIRATLEGIKERGLTVLPWTPDLRELCQRVTCLHRRHNPAWPLMSEETLLASVDEWLLPALQARTGRNRLKGLDLKSALLGLLNWEQVRDIDTLAPERLEVPSGSKIRLDYSNPDEPVLAVRLQEMFGATDTPRIAGGRIPITLHLLSPARRPVQVTQDLAGFWERTYAEVRKELKGRYPKHYWPDDPHQAEPTRRTRPRK